MLSLQNRLKKKDDFNRTFKSGRSVYGEFLSVKILEKGGSETKIGLSIGLGFSKKAPERNRIKRQIRAVMSKKLPQLKSGCSIIIWANKSLKPTITSKALAADLEKILINARLINRPNQEK